MKILGASSFEAYIWWLHEGCTISHVNHSLSQYSVCKRMSWQYDLLRLNDWYLWKSNYLCRKRASNEASSLAWPVQLHTLIAMMTKSKSCFTLLHHWICLKWNVCPSQRLVWHHMYQATDIEYLTTTPWRSWLPIFEEMRKIIHYKEQTKSPPPYDPTLLLPNPLESRSYTNRKTNMGKSVSFTFGFGLVSNV